MDNQGNIATSFDLDPDQYETTIYDLLTDLTDQHVTDAIVTISPKLNIIVANDDMSYLEIDVLTNTSKYPDCFDLLRRVIEKVSPGYDGSGAKFTQGECILYHELKLEVFR